jgi:ureidoacrylate peracid hydrolase
MQEVLTSFDQRIAPAHTALLVIDMQNDFCAEGGYLDRVMKRGSQGNAALAGRIQRLVEAARANSVPVIWITAIYDKRFLSAPVLAIQRQRGIIDEVCCARGSWGADFFVVAPRDDEFVVEKHRYSAFSGTELDNILRDHGIRTLVVTGVATNVCVESTLRDGFMNGHYIVVPEDCVGAYNPALHQATLDNVRALFGDVIDSAELIAQWGGA